MLVIVNWIIIIISYRNEVPICDILPDEENDIVVFNADYEIPVVTTDIPVTPSPAYATTTFTETEVVQVITTACRYKGDVDTSLESIVASTPPKLLVNS